MATQTTTAPSASSRREHVERTARTVAPLVDIYEADKAFVLLADMPGVGVRGPRRRGRAGHPHHPRSSGRPAATPDHQEFELADYHRASC
jgi:hypothetical protein